MRHLYWAVAFLAGACAAQADVYYEEEVVHSGVGPDKRGARSTLYKVWIKGSRQRVSADIETSEKMAKVLRSQGRSLRETTILLLDQGRLYDIDRVALTFRQDRLPAAKPAAAAKESPDREISFRTRDLKETKKIAGIRCRRVAAEMTARHFASGSREVKRTNRYLYQAWMADGFPGHAEIDAFLRMQKQKTSIPPVALGGGGLGDALEDPGRLERELGNLKGFPMTSRLEVFTASGGGSEKRILRLSRKILRMEHKTLSDTLFLPSAQLKRLR